MRGSQASACGHVLRDVKFFIFRLRFMHKRKRLVSACSLHAHFKITGNYCLSQLFASQKTTQRTVFPNFFLGEDCVSSMVYTVTTDYTRRDQGVDTKMVLVAGDQCDRQSN